MTALVHLSDCHVSTFGDSFHFRKHRIVRASKRFESETPLPEMWSEGGWRIVRDAKNKLVVIDSDGYAHKGWATPNASLESAVAYASRVGARTARALFAHPPNADQLLRLYAATPENTNLRLLAAARAMSVTDEAQSSGAPQSGITGDAEYIFVTGDITDDGDGYELLEAAFAPWIERGRFFAVPGNHDLYTVLIPSSVRPKPTRPSKRAAWEAFAGRIGLALDPSGAWARYLPDERVMIVGLDSCNTSQRRFFMHNGAIEAEQLDYLRTLAGTPAWKQAKHRIVGLHHHVVPLPHGIGRRAPPEIGMRLDNAKEVAAVFNELGVDLVLHGHRHVSEERRPAGCRFRILAAPSATLGCRSGGGPSSWRIDLDHKLHTERIEWPWPSLEHASLVALT